MTNTTNAPTVALMLSDLRDYETSMARLGVALTDDDRASRLYDAALDHTPAALRAGDSGAFRQGDDVQRFYEDALATLAHCNLVDAICDGGK